MERKENNRVVNIINFVRGLEPRCEVDLMTPVVEEIRLNKKYGFENTFLLQYDAMCLEEFVELFRREKDEHMELGIWIELARPLVESNGIEWTGRWDWDWYVNPGFLPAYTREQKEKIIDAIMEKFKSIFGYYPKSAGSWILDSDSIAYMKEKYQMQAFCICREQWGTDGYTHWGGYYNGPYFPSKNHILHPAQTAEGQIHVPVFRLLGADPIYCYYENLQGKYDGNMLGVVTLEPTGFCGQNRKWVEWYFKNLTEQEDMGYSYTQTGQENPFGWEAISKGLPMQMEYLATLQKEGKIRIEKLGDSGKYFSEMYELTPPTVYSALDDWAEGERQSVWYSCRYYRANVYCDGKEVWIRDIHMFDENYRDNYLDEPCREKSAIYDSLPVMDGLLFSDDDNRAGIYFGAGKVKCTERHEEQFHVVLEAEGKEIRVIMEENGITVRDLKSLELPCIWKVSCQEILEVQENCINYSHNGFGFRLELEAGKIEKDRAGGRKIVSDEGYILLKMKSGC